MVCLKEDNFIKRISLNESDFHILFDNVLKKSKLIKCRKEDRLFFQSWSLFSAVLGVFRGFKDSTAMPLFYQCLQYNYLPDVKIKRSKNKVIIAIYIIGKILNERKLQFEDSCK